jgi:hypothetical protein
LGNLVHFLSLPHPEIMSMHFRTLDMCGDGEMPMNFPTLKAVAQIDNCACGGIDKGPSIHCIPGYRGQGHDAGSPLLHDGSGLTILSLSCAVAFFT